MRPIIKPKLCHCEDPELVEGDEVISWGLLRFFKSHAMTRHLRVFFIFLILNTLYFILYTPVLAADYQSDYKVEYFLSEQQNTLNTRVKFTISVTNFRTDVYVKQFAIGFPKTFTIRNINASDDSGQIKPEIETDNEFTRIALEFSKPPLGKDSKGNFYLEFNQDNLFNVNGNVWEVIIPTLEGQQTKSYSIIVHLPANSNKKISISKPKPSNITGNTITWQNPTTKTVYAVFGDTQHYQTDLIYHLKNEKIIPVYTDIALPPDTLFQKIFIDNIQPTPAKVFTDSDGNYLARYYLGPKEKTTVNFKGTISVFTKPREELVTVTRNSIEMQKSYLKSPAKYWSLGKNSETSALKTEVKSIYDFVKNKLSYDYKKIETDNKRLGAEGALQNPLNAVCMEFTDLFVALARNKDIYAREIEGYGFSQDPKLRPISLVSDILHSWPEYYDQDSQLWKPVDPTWENTSGIDYFSSFDLNHIVFAIHGKDPEYPYPAGTYKFEDSRDISITATSGNPQVKELLTVEFEPFPKKINDSRIYKINFSLTNQGNTYQWMNPARIVSENIRVNPSELELGSLAPFETKSYSFTVNAAEKNKKTQGSFSIQLPQNKTLSSDFAIVPLTYEISLFIALVVGLISVTSVSIFLIRKAKHHAN